MVPEAIQEAAGLLLHARRDRSPLDELPPSCRPRSVADAYAIQDVVTRELGGAGGWKVGASDALAEPLCSPLPRSLIFPGGHRFPARSFRLNGVEAELAFTFGRDLPACATPYTIDEVAAAVRSIHAAIEVIDSRFESLRDTDPLSLLSDSASNGALVVGAGVASGVRVDQVRQAVEVLVDDEPVHSGVGGNTAGDVYRLLAWIANHAAARAGGLRAGQVVTTGSCSGVRFVAPGATVTARFPGVGEVALTLAR